MKTLIIFLSVMGICAAFWSSKPKSTTSKPSYPPKSTTSYPSGGSHSYPPKSTTSYPLKGRTSYPPKGTTSYPLKGRTSYPPKGTTSYPHGRMPRSTCSGCGCLLENCPMGDYSNTNGMEESCNVSMTFFYCRSKYLRQGLCLESIGQYETLRETLLSNCAPFGFTEDNPKTALPTMGAEDFYSTTTGYPFYVSTSYPSYGTTGYPYYSHGSTSYPNYYTTMGYPYHGSTGYPYYQTTAGYPYYPTYPTTSYPSYGSTGYPYYQTTAGYPYYPTYPTTSYPSYGSTGYPYYQTTAGYPYYPTTSYPSYGSTGYPYYQTTAGYPYYPTTSYPSYGSTAFPYYYTTAGYPGFDDSSCKVEDLSYCAQQLNVDKYGACSAYNTYLTCLEATIQSCPSVESALLEARKQLLPYCGTNDPTNPPQDDLPASIDKNSLLAFIEGALQETRETANDAEESLQAMEDVVDFIKG